MALRVVWTSQRARLAIPLMFACVLTGCAPSVYRYCEIDAREYRLLAEPPDARTRLLTEFGDPQFPVNGRKSVTEVWFENDRKDFAVCVYSREGCGYHEALRFEYMEDGWSSGERLSGVVCVS